MKGRFNYGSQKISALVDPQETVAYWLKLAPIIWKTKESKQKALTRLLFIDRKKPENKKSNDAKISALRTLIKKS